MSISRATMRQRRCEGLSSKGKGVRTPFRNLAITVAVILCLAVPAASLAGQGGSVIPNGGFEKDPAGTSYNDISDWTYEAVVHQGNSPTGDDLEVVDDYYFTGSKSVYSYLETTSVGVPSGVSQYLSTENALVTTADYITLWIEGDGYTTSSRYAWYINLTLTDGNSTYGEQLRCDCWGNNEGCTPNHFDNYDATATGADGRTWKRYTRSIPGDLDKSNLTVKIQHYQASWDSTTASSWYRLDNIYFSDSQGNPLPIVPNGGFEKDPAGTAYNDISDWTYEGVVHQGNAPTGDDLEIVDDYYFTGSKSLYSYLQTTSVGVPSGVSQYLSTENALVTTADYITLWIEGDGYTTSSRYAWYINLTLTDGNSTYGEQLICDCWGNNEGCTPNHFDNYAATETGADGRTWKRYTRSIPGDLDKSNLTVEIQHYQASWDSTTASSWYRLDDIYFSDSQGNPLLVNQVPALSEGGLLITALLMLVIAGAILGIGRTGGVSSV